MSESGPGPEERRPPPAAAGPGRQGEADRSAGPRIPASAPEVRRGRLVREFFLALRRSFVLGRCRSCEVFYLMARLCIEEGAEFLGPEERADVRSWADSGAMLDLDAGCEGACPVVPLYSRMSR